MVVGSSLVPRPMASQGGVLDVSLTAQTGRLSLAGHPVALYRYNGSASGPRLEIRSGDHVRIRFANRLPESTNLHSHGLHVRRVVRLTTSFSKFRQWRTRSMSFSSARSSKRYILVPPACPSLDRLSGVGWPGRSIDCAGRVGRNPRDPGRRRGIPGAERFRLMLLESC